MKFFKCNISIKIIAMLYLFSLCVQNLVCVLYLQHISIWTSHFSMLNSQMWLKANVLNSMAYGTHFPYFLELSYMLSCCSHFMYYLLY